MAKKYILRRKNKDSERDKYAYFKALGKGCDVTTPFKDQAKVFNESDEVTVYTEGWEFIRYKSEKN